MRPRFLLYAELRAQAGHMVGANLVLARFAGLLVQVAALRVGRLAAIGRRHLMLYALAEGRTGLALAFLIDLLARFALLRVGRLGAIEVLHLFMQALLPIGADLVLARFVRLLAGLLVRLAGFRVGCLGAVARAAPHAALAHARKQQSRNMKEAA